MPPTGYEPVEVWNSMGTVGHLVLIFLLLMSIYSTGTILERWLAFHRAHRQSRAFRKTASSLVADDRFAELLAEAERHPRSPIARIYAAAIRDALPWQGNGRPVDGCEQTIRTAAEREAVLAAQDLRRGMAGLASIASTAPFVGLFGTVVGIMNSFFGMAATGSGGIGAVSGGIAEALVNTAAGILVALPAVWGFNHLLGRLGRVQNEMSNAVSELVDHFIKRSRSDSWKLEATTGQPAAR
ncbi:MAG: MotA/TolQ/ExbB proton channel family protein [Candidatus Eisenbacteria bacterium]|nr:MotA/TolQ/ExbB proton channel family protein [Candidatus Eisenbacteria bacterium]